MFRIDVWGLVDHPCDTIAWRIDEEGIIWIENLARDHLVPFTKQATLKKLIKNVFFWIDSS